ncbi:bactericidal permeability-increasing protein isoform X3 [Tachysurus ichikawai]
MGGGKKMCRQLLNGFYVVEQNGRESTYDYSEPFTTKGSSMTIVRCDLPEPSVSFSEGTGMSLKMQGLSLAITGRWNTNFGFM